MAASAEFLLNQILGNRGSVSLEYNLGVLLAQYQAAIAAGFGSASRPFIVVAASNASAGSILAADAAYKCDGVADEIQINAALALASVIGGAVQLTEGTFNVAGPVVLKSNVFLRGVGAASIVKLTAGVGGRTVQQLVGGVVGIGLADVVFDGNGSNQSNGASRNDGATAHISNVTNLVIDNVVFKNARSGAGLLVTTCVDVKILNPRFETNGKSGTANFEADQFYLGDCFRVKIAGMDADTCTDTGLAVEGCQYVTVLGPTIQNPGAGAQCLAVSSSPSQGAKHIVVTSPTLVGAGGTTYGIRIGRFGNPTDPENVQIVSPNISSVDIGISIDEGDRIEISIPQIKLADSPNATNYIGIRLGAGSSLVNVVGGRAQNAVTGIDFIAGHGAPAFTGFDVAACLSPIAGTPAAGTRAVNCPGWVTLKSGAQAAVSDGGTITHGLVATPTRVTVTPSVAGEMGSVTALGATTFTVALKTHAGAAGTPQTVHWAAEKIY